MPFEGFTPRSFTAASVRANAPAGSGIYGVSNAREWIYIGESDNIQASLIHTLDQSDSSVLKRYPTGFVFELCIPTERLSRQSRLILEYAPVCNGPSPGSEAGGRV
jgi:hypothetical protein